MYPKSKSPLELKYERLRGICSRAWENVRYIPIDNGIQQHGGSRVWQGMAVYGWCCVYISISVYGQHGGRAWRYTNATRGILVYDIQTQYTPAITIASQRPDACIAYARACVCVRYIIILLYYYNIIILLYLYIPNISSIPSILNNGNIAL